MGAGLPVKGWSDLFCRRARFGRLWAGARRHIGAIFRLSPQDLRRSAVAAGLALAASLTPFAPVAARAASPLTSLHSVRMLTDAEADKALPVAFEATVTYIRDYEATLFVQDGDDAIFVMYTGPAALRAGDRVLIRGTSQPSFRPIVNSNDIVLLRHGGLPEPQRATFAEMIRGGMDCRYVSVRGMVRSAAVTLSSGHHVTQLELVMDGGDAGVTIDSADAIALKGLLDAEVEVAAVASARFDSKMQQVGVLLHASAMDAVKVIRKAPADAQSLPVTPMDHILDAYHVNDLSDRVHVRGVLTYFQPASMAVLQDGARSIRVLTAQIDPLTIGEYAEATGIPTVSNGFLTLRLGEIRNTGAALPVEPLPVSWDDLASGHSAYNLVSIDGKLVTQVREHSQDIYVISSRGHLFSAALRHPYAYDWKADREPPPMIGIAEGSRVRATGIALLDDGNPHNDARTFGMLLRTPADVAVIAGPPLLSVRNLIIVVALLLSVAIAAGVRGWALERKVRRQAITLASRIEAEAGLERRRSRILEDINGARPLSEIVLQITEMVSVKLGGAPCWCRIADGARLGAIATDEQKKNAASQVVLSRSGTILGTLFVVVGVPDKPTTAETEALTVGTGLIELAVETRKLYTDLRRRSEFDLLTEVHNRFSLEKMLNALIDDANEDAGVFGLIYVDLDDFKKVNDIHGHQVGDLYLQEVAARMKRQLRAGDLLARLGGDEFAALTPTVRCRADVEEVALRLERCFDDPFTAGSVRLHGSASVGIALYPDDGDTRDSLLSAADARMYAAKNRRRAALEAVSAVR